MEPPATGSSGAEGHGRRSAGVSFAACARLLLHTSSFDRIRQVCMQSRIAVALMLRGDECLQGRRQASPAASLVLPQVPLRVLAGSIAERIPVLLRQAGGVPLHIPEHDEHVMTCSMASRCSLQNYPSQAVSAEFRTPSGMEDSAKAVAICPGAG